MWTKLVRFRSPPITEKLEPTVHPFCNWYDTGQKKELFFLQRNASQNSDFWKQVTHFHTLHSSQDGQLRQLFQTNSPDTSSSPSADEASLESPSSAPSLSSSLSSPAWAATLSISTILSSSDRMRFSCARTVFFSNLTSSSRPPTSTFWRQTDGQRSVFFWDSELFIGWKFERKINWIDHSNLVGTNVFTVNRGEKHLQVLGKTLPKGKYLVTMHSNSSEVWNGRIVNSPRSKTTGRKSMASLLKGLGQLVKTEETPCNTSLSSGVEGMTRDPDEVHFPATYVIWHQAATIYHSPRTNIECNLYIFTMSTKICQQAHPVTFQRSLHTGWRLVLCESSHRNLFLSFLFVIWETHLSRRIGLRVKKKKKMNYRQQNQGLTCNYNINVPENESLEPPQTPQMHGKTAALKCTFVKISLVIFQRELHRTIANQTYKSHKHSILLWVCTTKEKISDWIHKQKQTRKEKVMNAPLDLTISLFVGGAFFF